MHQRVLTAGETPVLAMTQQGYRPQNSADTSATFALLGATMGAFILRAMAISLQLTVSKIENQLLLDEILTQDALHRLFQEFQCAVRVGGFLQTAVSDAPRTT